MHRLRLQQSTRIVRMKNINRDLFCLMFVYSYSFSKTFVSLNQNRNICIVSLAS